ncbi:MAG: carbohydrate ABC transporter permease, partial [Propionibacteriaceae bacterium]|nr:carbohydrate ABC transporter permease [Propionibacteriaceae bacterium]
MTSSTRSAAVVHSVSSSGSVPSSGSVSSSAATRSTGSPLSPTEARLAPSSSALRSPSETGSTGSTRSRSARFSPTKTFRAYDRPWRQRGSSDMFKPRPALLVMRYVIMVLLLVITVFPFLWQLSTSLKGSGEDIYTFPPQLFPQAPTLEHYATVSRTIPILSYAWHSFLVAGAQVISNVLFATMGGYALALMRFRGKAVVMGLFLSTMLLPGEVTLTSQYLTIKALGVQNSLIGVFLPGAVGAMNVLLMATACLMMPTGILDAAVIDGANTWQRIRYIVWPNIRGMASVVALFSFIG